MVTRFERVATVAWGELPLTLVQDPPFSELLPDQARSVPAPIRLRLGPKSSVHLLGGEPTSLDSAQPRRLVHLDASGSQVGSVSLPPPAEGESLADYAVAEDLTCYLLDVVRAPGPGARLTAVAADGDIRWSRITSSVTADGLALVGSSRLLLSETGSPRALEIDISTGDMVDTIEWGLPANHLYAAGDDAVALVLYDPEANRRGIGHVDLSSHRFTKLVGGRELFRWLLAPIGADSAGDIYAVNDSRVARISAVDGRVDVLTTFDAIVATPGDEQLFTSRVDPAEPAIVVVDEYDPAGELIGEYRLALPPSSDADHDDADWRLIQVDIDHQLYVFGGEGPGRLGSAYRFAADGSRHVVESSSDLLAAGSRLQRPYSWQLGADGRLYLPVLSQGGVTVVRLAAD